MRFQQHILLVEGRAAADIRDAIVNALVRPVLDFDLYCIDAERRLDMILERQVGGREADGAAALIALLDMRFHRPPMAEQFRGAARIAPRQQLADAGRGIGLAAVAHFIDNRNAEAFHPAHIGKRRRVAAARLAEAKS